MAYFLGIDGGGTKTTCVIGDESNVLAKAVAGPCNITRVGEFRARESLHQVIREACTAAGIGPGELTVACAGVAGAGREEVATLLKKLIAEIIPAPVHVMGDMQIALQAAIGEGPGIVVIAGTGSIAYGRDGRGRTARAGGWGFAISDEGSAHWIGREAVAAVLRAADATFADPIERDRDDAFATASLLFQNLASSWKVDSLPHLASMANAQPEFAALLPVVLAAANANDEIAKDVLIRAGRELARLAEAVARRLFSTSAGKVAIGTAGGVFRHAAQVRQSFSEELRNLDSRLEVNPEIIEPVDGALQIARQLNGTCKANI